MSARARLYDDSAMTVHVRWDQCCETKRCTRPARHGALCAACYMAATPARRRVELSTPADLSRVALEALWTLPAGER